jgi:hypothetical protein
MVKPGTRLLSDFSKWRDELVFPDLEAVDWAGDAAYQREVYDPDRLHVFHCAEGCFERLHEVIPFDEALAALIEDPDEVRALFEAVADYKIRVFEKLFEYYEPIDTIIYGDDWGTQRAGFFSDRMFKEMIKPQAKRIIQLPAWPGQIRRAALLRPDAAIHRRPRRYGPHRLDAAGINDFNMLKRDWGDKMTFTIPIAGLDKPGITEGEVRSLVRAFVDAYAGAAASWLPLWSRTPTSERRRTTSCTNIPARITRS